MGKKIILLLAVAIVAMVMIPATASAGLVNEYGMHYAGQQTCVDCHAFFGGTTTDTVHTRFVKEGLLPLPPADWTEFRAAGTPPVIAGTPPALFAGGGSYDVDQPWLTFGDFAGGAATEYAFWRGPVDPDNPDYNVLPWNLVEGLVAEPMPGHPVPVDEGEYLVGSEDPERGLFDVQYGCQRCHMLGSTIKNTAAGEIVPNDAATIQPTTTTARQWARDDATSVADFMDDPTVSYPGMSIQCENCHGTGLPATPAEGGHTNTGVKVSTTLDVLGQSQVCGQCHGSYTNVAGTLGIYGFTPNEPMREFVNINGVSGGAMYTYIPTEAEFMAAPTKYFMFPNGSNARGSHYYYNEWSATAHSYRGAYYKPRVPADTTQPQTGPLPADFSPDALIFQSGWGTPTDPPTDPLTGEWGNGHFNATAQSSIDNQCYKCHTGEGYLYSKGAKIAEDFTPAVGNIGLMGQECVTCHSPHPSAPGAEDVLREPDKAGERSAVGLTVDNASICEDCHNWQKEVQGAAWTGAIKPIASLAGRGGPSHPQRETYHGRIMLDVDPAGEFMPNVKCENCHMPKTNRSANRFSHGMKIMLPGKADEWMTAATNAGSNVYRGEDSCSKCHPGENREELQANIDEWQGDTTAQAEETAAAIMAAQTRSEFSMTDVNSPGYVLAGRATWNYKSWVNDGSTGAHNPEYIMDGLVKAEQMAKSVGGSFANLFASESVLPGGTGFVTGKVVNGDGSGAAGASLKLNTGATTTADGQGNFAFMVNPVGVTTYSVKWLRSDDVKSDLTSPSRTVGVAKWPSTTTLKASATSIAVNKSIKLSGKVNPAAVGQIVKIQYRRSTTASWKAWANATLSATSQYSKTKALTSKGSWYFRTLYAGTNSVASSKSAAVKVIVK